MGIIAADPGTGMGTGGGGEETSTRSLIRLGFNKLGRRDTDYPF